MTVAAFLAWAKANEALLVSLALIVSEYLGANPNIKANGIVSLFLIQLRKALTERETPSS